MKPFSYVNPTNEKDAVAALSPDFEKALPIGGGQDLLARLKDYVTQTDKVVNVKNALESTVVASGGGLKIGAAMRMVDVAEHAEIGRMYPAIAAAAIGLAVRNAIGVSVRSLPLTPAKIFDALQQKA